MNPEKERNHKKEDAQPSPQLAPRSFSAKHKTTPMLDVRWMVWHEFWFSEPGSCWCAVTNPTPPQKTFSSSTYDTGTYAHSVKN
jgi:hypothetical protein